MNSPTNYDLMRLFEDHKETIRSGLKEVRQVRVPFPPPPIFVSDKEPEPDFAYLAVARFEIRYIPDVKKGYICGQVEGQDGWIVLEREV